jgi:site-specific recombinase XerD
MLGEEIENAAAEWLAVKEAEGLRPDTIRTYGDHIHIFLRWLAGRELIPLLFAAFFRDYAKTHSIASCASIYNSVRLLLKGIGRPDLAGTMRRPRGETAPKCIYSEGQLRALFQVLRADRTATGLRDHAIVCLLRYCGLRASEICNLRLDDLLDNEEAVSVRGGKSRYARRRVPLMPPSSQVLAAYLGRGRPKLLRRGAYADHLLLTVGGAPLTRNSLRMLLRRLGERVGFPVSAHRFRHTWATAHVRARTNPAVIGHLAGWSPKTLYDMMATYSHPDLEALREAQREAFG